jgi:preprotein translocase subunit SecG
MTTVLLVLQFVLTAVLTVAVLLQKSASIGLGAYSGSNESLFGAKGPAGFMAKFTFIVGILFLANTISLGYFYNKSKKVSIAEDIKIEKSVVPSTPAPTTSVPAAPSAPEAPSSK